MLNKEIELKFIKAASAIAKRNSNNLHKLVESITILYHTGLRQHNSNVNLRTKLEHSVQLTDAIMIGVFSILSAYSDPLEVDFPGSDWRMALGLPPAPIVSPGQS